MFNPLLGDGVLIYKNDYLSRQITVRVTGSPELTEKTELYGKYTVELTAYNPFWRSMSENALKMGGFTGGIEYPLFFSGESVTFANKSMNTLITTTSDVETPLRIEFAGPCDTPVISCGTNHIELDTEILTGEKIIITTGFGEKLVRKIDANGNETNVNHLISNTSTFFSLQPGSNNMTFTAQYGTPAVYLYWHDLYVGV